MALSECIDYRAYQHRAYRLVSERICSSERISYLFFYQTSFKSEHRSEKNEKTFIAESSFRSNSTRTYIDYVYIDYVTVLIDPIDWWL